MLHWETLHFAALRSHVGKCVEDVCQLVSGEVLGIMVPAIYGPSQHSAKLLIPIYCFGEISTHQLTK